MRHQYLPVVLVVLLGGSETVRADQPPGSRQVTAVEIDALIESLIADRQIVTDLTVLVVESQTRFQVTSRYNAEEVPWVIQVNIGNRKFRENSKRYSDEGYELSVHRVVSIGRRTLHSAVWVQALPRNPELVLPDGEVPESGDLGRHWTPLNDLIKTTLRDNNIPGATIAVAYRGTLLCERGFGFSDIEESRAMAPDATMRIASISKSITAVAVLILAEQGKVELDTPVLDYLARHPRERFDVSAAIKADERWQQATVRHLLQHSGGMDSDKSRDTVFQLVDVTRTMKLHRPAGIPDVVRYQLTRPLDFEPGSAFAYSNVGYCLLGRIIEAVTGQTYEAFIQESVLKPAGMNSTRLGRARLRDRAPDEVLYYTQQVRKFPAIWDVVDEDRKSDFEMVEAPYGQWDLEVMDSHGGWTSTAADLVRFASAIDSESAPLLKQESMQLLKQAPAFVNDTERSVWYGLGWNVRRINSNGDCSLWHTGALAGTSALLVHRWDGFTWAILFNCEKTKSGDRCADLVDRPLHRAIEESARILD